MSAFDLDRIRDESGAAALDYHEQLDSTNTRALELAAANDRQLPLLVLTNHQQAGRGRGPNRWWAGYGALTFSLVVNKPIADVAQKNWPLISLGAGLAVAEAIESLVPVGDVRIKWPNDVYLKGRKVCGILVETVPHQPDIVVLGIGINVNNSPADAPPELQAFMTSLVEMTHRALDRTEVLLAVLRCLANRLPLLKCDAWQLAEAWRERCYLQGRTVQLDTGTQRITGVCQGIDDQGALLLYTETGIQRCFGGVVAKII